MQKAPDSVYTGQGFFLIKFLPSHTLARAVPSGQWGLTAVLTTQSHRARKLRSVRIRSLPLQTFYPKKRVQPCTYSHKNSSYLFDRDAPKPFPAPILARLTGT